MRQSIKSSNRPWKTQLSDALAALMPWWGWPIVAALATLTIWIRLSVVQWTYESSEAQRTITVLKQTFEQTQLEVTRLRSPKRLQELARGQFSLAPPTPQRTLVLEEEPAQP